MGKPPIRAVLIALALTVGASGAARAWQYSNIPIGRPTADTLPPLGAGHGSDDTAFGTREMQAHQLKMLRELHQKQVIADSDRLLRLATELKAETDQGTTATPNQLKDLEEIARLAKRLSERIKSE